MSLINKMLQDLDKRHAADGGGKTLTQQLRPVPARKGWRRIMWEVGIGLVIGAGWAAWVLHQISPRPLVTDMVVQAQANRPPMSAPPPAPVAPAAPAPAQAAASQPPVAAALAPAPPAGAGAQSANVDMLKLATEIATPFSERSFAAKPRPERGRAAAAAPSANKGQQAPASVAQGEPAPKIHAAARIDKRVRVQTPAERAEDAFRIATELLNQGRVAEAIDGYKSILQQDAGHAAARQALVGLLLENRRVDEAQQYLEEGLNLHPERFTYAMLLARIRVERGDLQGAHDLLNKYAVNAAGDAEYHAFDAALLQRLGRHKEAITGYQAALKLAPQAGLWWMGLGISLQADNQGKEALDAFRRAKSEGGLSAALVAFVDQRMKQLQ